MANIISITIGTIIGTVSLLITIILTIICCYKRSHPNQSISKQEDALHSVIINKHVRSNSSTSFINNDYHNNMTLLASARRLAILELEQQTETFAYENPSLDYTELTHTKTMRF
jgi:hypothetical protein